MKHYILLMLLMITQCSHASMASGDMPATNLSSVQQIVEEVSVVDNKKETLDSNEQLKGKNSQLGSRLFIVTAVAMWLRTCLNRDRGNVVAYLLKHKPVVAYLLKHKP